MNYSKEALSIKDSENFINSLRSFWASNQEYKFLVIQWGFGVKNQLYTLTVYVAGQGH